MVWPEGWVSLTDLALQSRKACCLDNQSIPRMTSMSEDLRAVSEARNTKPSIAIEGLVFLASLTALKSSDIDVILGMDWLSRQHAFLDCKAKSVKLTHPSGQTIDYTSPSSRTQMHTLNVLPLPDLEDIPVVRDFPDVFPEELPGAISSN